MKVTKQNKTKQFSKSKPKPVRVVSSPARAPVAESKVISHMGRPNIKPLGNAGDCIVIHREYISDLLASATAGAFSVIGIPINPGNSAMFPWLSQLAENFESYTFRTLKFLFETSAATSTPGTVLMAVDYDVSDSVPASKLEMMSYRDATRSPAWECNTLNCTKEDLHKRKTYYVNDVASSGGSFAPSVLNDLRLDDVGELLVGSSNSGVSAQLGEMYVEYEVELKTPEGVGTDLGGTYIAKKQNGSVVMTNSLPFGSVSGYTNTDRYTYLYEGLSIRYTTPGGADSGWEFSRPGTYSISISVKPATVAATSITVGFDSTNSNAVINPASAVGTSYAMWSGLYVVRNTLPGTSGAVGLITLRTGGATYASNDTAEAIIRISKIPDYDSNQSNANGWISLSARPERPVWTFRRKERLRFRLEDFDSPPACSALAGTSSDDKEKESPDCCVSNRSSDMFLIRTRDCPPLERGPLRVGRSRSGGLW